MTTAPPYADDPTDDHDDEQRGRHARPRPPFDSTRHGGWNPPPPPQQRRPAPGTWVDPAPSGRHAGPAPGTWVDPPRPVARPTGPPGTWVDPPPGRRAGPPPGTWADPAPTGYRGAAPGTWADPSGQPERAHPGQTHAVPGTWVDAVPGSPGPARGTWADPAPSQPTRWVRVNLPPTLAHRYTWEKDLESVGGEADLMVCRLNGTDERHVVKLFRGRARLDSPEFRRRLAGAHDDHVVRVHDRGVDHGTPWEVQEYIVAGSLDDMIVNEGRLPISNVRAVLVEIADALEHLHGLGLLHLDLKPANVLVRTREPLDLVLADFGLSTTMSRSMQSRVAHTAAYAAPETMHGRSTPECDWWSLGITITELMRGQHPFQEPDGTWMSQQRIGSWIATQAIPLDGIEDERWLLLLRGLLTRNPEWRWGADEIRSWLDGGSPPVAAEADIAPPSTPGARPAGWPLTAAPDRLVRTPEDLADFFNETWGDGLPDLVANRLDDLADWIGQFGEPDLDRAVEGLRTSRKRDHAMSWLLLRLGPRGDPAFAGVPIHPQGLAAFATRVVQKPASGGGALRRLRGAAVLEMFADAEVRDHEVLRGVEGRWGALQTQLETWIAKAALPADGRENATTAAEAALLGCLVSPDLRIDVGQQAARARNRPSGGRHWFAALVADGSHDPIVADCLVTAALGMVIAEEAAEARREEDRARQEAERVAQQQREAAALRRTAMAAGDVRPLRVAVITSLTGILPWLIGQFLWLPALAALPVPAAGYGAMSPWAGFVPSALFGVLVVFGLFGLWLARAPRYPERRGRTVVGIALVVLALCSPVVANSLWADYVAAAETSAAGS